MRKYDTVIQNARVLDGTGAPGLVTDVAVSGDRIAAMGKLNADSAAARIDADGLVLTPGFIDAHTHDDRALLVYPDMTAKVSQGVTCVVTGNCGISITPLENREPVAPLNLLGDQAAWQFPDFDAYSERLDRSPSAINSIMLTGHSTLRVGAMDELDRPANCAEIEKMCNALAQCLDAGCAGLSTGLAYPPAWNATTEEVIELAKIVNDYGRVYTTHMRDEEDDVLDSIEETLRIGREAEVPTVISHHKVCGRANWGRTRETLEMIRDARKHQKVDCDVYPYTASSTVLLKEFVHRSERVMITWSKSHPEFSTWDLNNIADEMGCDIYGAIERLQPAGAIYFQMSDEDLERVLKFEGAMIGSDGLPHDEHPHPRLWGTFPRVLGHYCRDRKLFPLEQAVHRMTGATAEVFGLDQRGVIRPGNFADLVLFDPDTIIDRATYESPDTQSVGVQCVMVNGKIVFDGEQVTGTRAGRLLHGV
jgi:N-acyl-D-amino-acid deacylase